jgi:hypothetical protein
MKRLFFVLMGLLFLGSIGLASAATEAKLHKVKHHLKKDIKADKKDIHQDKKDIAQDKIKKDEDQAAAKQALADGNDKAAIKDEKAAIAEKKDIHADVKDVKADRKDLHQDKKKLHKVNKAIAKGKDGKTSGDDWNGNASGTAPGMGQGAVDSHGTLNKSEVAAGSNGGAGSSADGNMGQASAQMQLQDKTAQ